MEMIYYDTASSNHQRACLHFHTEKQEVERQAVNMGTVIISRHSGVWLRGWSHFICEGDE